MKQFRFRGSRKLNLPCPFLFCSRVNSCNHCRQSCSEADAVFFKLQQALVEITRQDEPLLLRVVDGAVLL